MRTKMGLLWYLSIILFILQRESSSQSENRAPRNPTSLPQRVNGKISLPTIKVDTTGRISVSQISRQQLANELGLPLRDFRIVDPSYPKLIQTTFTSRKKAILFCIENIKVVVLHNEALVFSPDQKEVRQ
jgi:hypothetical protein